MSKNDLRADPERWKAFVEYRERLKASGIAPSEANKQALTMFSDFEVPAPNSIIVDLNAAFERREFRKAVTA